MTFSGNSQYVGEWIKDKINGQGHMVWAFNGDSYKGMFKDGVPDGHGVYTYSTGA